MFWVSVLTVLGIVLLGGAFVAAVLTMAKSAGSDQDQDDDESWFT
jgi:hypothetical protein